MASLFDTYIPAASEVTSDMITSARTRLAEFWLQFDSTADVAAGTIIGDRLITPYAGMCAAVEEGVRRLMSDMDPQNVAGGTIYSCDFVSRFLDNFGVYAVPEQPGSGILRLTFDATVLGIDEDYVELDRSLRFKTESGDSVPEFELVIGNPGNLFLRVPGAAGVDGTNQKWMVEVGADRFVVDVSVVSHTPVTVTSGTAMLLSDLPASLEACVAVADFHSGITSSSLSALAKMTRDTAYAATPAQLGGMRRFVKQTLPRVQLVTAVGPGDTSMQRGSTNALGFPSNAIDVRVRGADAWLLDEQQVWLAYTTDGSTYSRFCGEWAPLETPLLLRNIVPQSDATVQVTPTIWGQSQDSRAPLMTAAGSGLEKYWISLDMPTDGGGVDLIALSTLRGESGAWFTVSYLCDPSVTPARDVITAKDNSPVGIDVLVKPFFTMEFTTFSAKYRKKPGVVVGVTTARSEISTHILGCGWPDAMSEASWIDTMYYAGAKSVIGFDVAARMVWSMADFWLPDLVDPINPINPVTNWIDSYTNKVAVPVIEVTDTADLTPVYTSYNNDLNCACDELDIGWYIDDTIIKFNEHA